MELELMLRKECFSPATNLPRKTRLRTRTGRKKRIEERIQRESSGVRPPAGMTQWTCGWCCRFCPQVCSTLRKPMSAPRCFGSAATSSSVAALARNSRS